MSLYSFNKSLDILSPTKQIPKEYKNFSGVVYLEASIASKAFLAVNPLPNTFF